MSDQQHTQQHHQHHHQAPFAGAVGGGEECVLCPLCVLLQAVTASRPEVTEHLVAAGRELSRALSSLFDGHARASQASEQRLQRIKVD